MYIYTHIYCVGILIYKELLWLVVESPFLNPFWDSSTKKWCSKHCLTYSIFLNIFRSSYDHSYTWHKLYKLFDFHSSLFSINFLNCILYLQVRELLVWDQWVYPLNQLFERAGNWLKHFSWESGMKYMPFLVHPHVGSSSGFNFITIIVPWIVVELQQSQTTIDVIFILATNRFFT